MRLEQLVLFGPSDNFTIQFGPRVTVLAGLDDAEREGMLQTLVDAMAGRVPNASVIFVDQAGRRVYADRMGATYAESGVAAPSLSDLLGTDPTVVGDLVTLRPEDLGLGERRDPTDIEAELTAATAGIEQLVAERAQAEAIVIQVTSWQEEVAALDELIARLPEEHARWSWMQLRNRLDALRAELAALDRDGDDHHGDERLLEAVEELRSAGETWAEASTAAEELSAELGPLPPVSDADLARVAATPEALPADLDERIAELTAVAELSTLAIEELARASAPAEDPGDGIVYQLAQIDQDRLWASFVAARKAQAIYEAELEERQGEVDPVAESAIDTAHHEVVRAQREVDRRFRPGMLGAATLAVTALLAGDAISILLGVVLLAAAVAMGVWLLVRPRQALAAAMAEEEAALGQADADSWLGMHLKRIEDVMPRSDRTGLDAAMDLRASTRLDWEELTGGVSLEAVAERQEAIEAYAAAIDPQRRAERERAARHALAEAARVEDEARLALTASLAAYGLTAQGAADLSPEQIRGVLEQRTAAGRFARRAVDLQHHLATATTAGAMLDRLLRDLGFADGDLAGRLERAIVAIEAARRRRAIAEDTRAREELVAEIEELAALVERGRRMTWDLTEDPREAPADQAATMDRRRALLDQIGSTRLPDVADVERRLGIAEERVRTLEAELATIDDGPGAVRRRLADRIARTTWVGSQEEALPLLIDDAMVGVEPEELFKLLDMVVRLSSRTQIVLLSSDATIAKWARREAAHGVITLFESDGAAVR